jgi:hypothetical protein
MIAILVTSAVVTVTSIGEIVGKSGENVLRNAHSKRHAGWASIALASSVWDAAASRFVDAQMVSA